MFSLGTVAGDMSNSSSFGGSQSSKHMEMEFAKSREFMGSDFFHQSPGLARYRSAPSSFLGALLDSPADNSSSGDESDAALFSAIWSGPRDLNHKIGGGGDDSQMQPQFHLKQEIGAEPGLTSYESPAAVSGGGTVVGSYSAGLETQVQVRLNSGNGISGSNLLRQSSSPAGFFNGFGVSSSHLAFSSSGASSSPRMMPSIPENGSIDDGCENGRLRNGNIRELEAAPFSHETWSDSSRINDMKRNRDGNLKMFSAFNEMQNQVHNASVDTVKSSASLVHHLNLPKSLNEKGEPEKFKFLQFQPDVVPCQIRAKRGCATHPRSIAERMRRTRISERMKKLQELFPNMDKQTSTADMLDMAVEYIKDLQRQVQTLSETKTKCVCSPPERNTGK